MLGKVSLAVSNTALESSLPTQMVILQEADCYVDESEETRGIIDGALGSNPYVLVEYQVLKGLVCTDLFHFFWPETVDGYEVSWHCTLDHGSKKAT